jgi:D-3-phosphoglycerate dehydrogenase / 2-oxoglutarate reductase
MARILVTPRSVTRYGGHPSLEPLREKGHEVIFSTAGRQPGEEELLDLLPGCAGYLAGVEPITRRVLEAAKELKVISRNGTGVDSIDLAAAEELGIRVERAAGANARGVAELALGHILALARGIPENDAALKAGRWEREKGIEVKGRSLGIIGCGVIGRMLTEMARGIGMRVIAFDVVEDPGFRPAESFRYAPLEEVIANSDFISLHCPPPPDNRPLLDSAAFEKMREGVYIINTARAGLIDDAALQDALESGRVAGVAIDVFEEEPPADMTPLNDARIIASPHVGGFTEESVQRAMEAAVANMLAVLDGAEKE